MKQLSLTQINAKAPYHVVWAEENKAFIFESDYGVEISVSFDVSWIISNPPAYELTIANHNHKPSPRDRKVRDTVGAIVEEFFRENQTAILYICETGDQKQAMRSRLFMVWLDKFNTNGEYEVLTASMNDEGVENYAAMILRKDNCHFAEYVAEFNDTVTTFNAKPKHD